MIPCIFRLTIVNFLDEMGPSVKTKAGVNVNSMGGDLIKYTAAYGLGVEAVKKPFGPRLGAPPRSGPSRGAMMTTT